MSRPLYESQSDLQRELEITTCLSNIWQCSFTKMPIRYHLDFVVVKDDKAIAFCEIKSRNYTMQKINDMGGYLLSIGKWASAKNLYDCSGLPFVLVVKTLDGIWWSSFKNFKEVSVKVKGRTDRDDWQDIEPCVLLPITLFKKINSYSSTL